MDVKEALRATSPEHRSEALEALLSKFMTPAFGALTKRELELAFVEALVTVGYLQQNPTVYEMIERLRVTRSRARSLVYDRDLRRQDQQTLRDLARWALRNPHLQSQGHVVAIDIENPLLADYLRDVVRGLGHASDGSFSPTMIRLSPEAAAALIADLLTPAERRTVTRALTDAGVPDKSLKGAITAIIIKAATKFGDATGEAIAKDAIDVFGPILDGKAALLAAAVKRLFAQSD